MKNLLIALTLLVACGDNTEPQFDANACEQYQAWAKDSSTLPYIELTTQNISVDYSYMQPLFSDAFALHNADGHNYAMLVKAVKLHWIDDSVHIGTVLQDDNNMCMWSEREGN